LRCFPGRYGIKVDQVAQALTGEHTRVLSENADGDASRRVRAVMVFIASIGDEAEMITVRFHLLHTPIVLILP
jgi:hypothetical protein